MKNILSLLIICLLSNYTATAQENIQSKINKGKDFLKTQQYSEAAKVFEDILKSNPVQKDALSGVVASYAYLNQLKSAQAAVDKSIAVNPNDADILILRAKVLGLREQYEDAVKEFEKALPSASDSLKSTIHANIAFMQNQAYKYELAAVEAQKSISFNEKNADAFMNLGLAQYGLSRFSDSIDSFSLAINLTPNNGQAYYNRSMAYFKTNDKTNGCADAQRACKYGNKSGCLQYATECQK